MRLAAYWAIVATIVVGAFGFRWASDAKGQDYSETSDLTVRIKGGAPLPNPLASSFSAIDQTGLKTPSLDDGTGFSLESGIGAAVDNSALDSDTTHAEIATLVEQGILPDEACNAHWLSPEQLTGQRRRVDYPPLDYGQSILDPRTLAPGPVSAPGLRRLTIARWHRLTLNIRGAHLWIHQTPTVG